MGGNVSKPAEAPIVSLEEKKELFLKIEQHVNVQLQRLHNSPEGIYSMSPTTKSSEIVKALERLYFAAFSGIPNPDASRWTKRAYYYHSWLHKLNPKDKENADFSTFDGMLDASFSVWEEAEAPWTDGGMEFRGHPARYKHTISLRSALNISRDNFFNFPGCTFGPFFGGKTKALEEFEKDLAATPTVELR